MNTKYLLNIEDLVEVYDDGLSNSLENISWSIDSSNGKVEICRCTKYQEQDPEFIVFKDKVIGGIHYYILPGSVDLFKSVFPNGVVGNPFITNFGFKGSELSVGKQLKECLSESWLEDLAEAKESDVAKWAKDTLDEYRKLLDKYYYGPIDAAKGMHNFNNRLLKCLDND